MQTKSVVDKTCGHGALPVGGFMATPIGAHVLSFCQKYPSAGRTKIFFSAEGEAILWQWHRGGKAAQRAAQIQKAAQERHKI